MDYILALGQGTTGSRAMQFDREGRVPGMAQKKLRQIYPQPGWVEHDPTEISRTAPTAAERRRAANPLETGLRA